METQLVTVPELTFEPSYGSKYGNEKEKKKKQKTTPPTNPRKQKEEKTFCFLCGREEDHCSRQSQGEFAVPGHFVIVVVVLGSCSLSYSIAVWDLTWQQKSVSLKQLQLVSIVSTHPHAKSPKVSSVTDSFLKNMNSLTLSGTMTKKCSFHNDLVNETLFFPWLCYCFFLTSLKTQKCLNAVLSEMEWKSNLSHSFVYKCHT